jgi:hypothetical protein
MLPTFMTFAACPCGGCQERSNAEPSRTEDEKDTIRRFPYVSS